MPTIIGVTADQEFGPAGERIVTLDDGREVRLPMSAEVAMGASAADRLAVGPAGVRARLYNNEDPRGQVGPHLEMMDARRPR